MYFLFELARDLHQTVRQMLTGDPVMMHMEFYLWQRYRLATARLEYQQRRGRGH